MNSDTSHKIHQSKLDMNQLLQVVGLTKTELAEILGIHRGCIYQWKIVPRYALSFLVERKKRLAAEKKLASMEEVVEQLTRRTG